VVGFGFFKRFGDLFLVIVFVPPSNRAFRSFYYPGSQRFTLGYSDVTPPVLITLLHYFPDVCAQIHG